MRKHVRSWHRVEFANSDRGRLNILGVQSQSREEKGGEIMADFSKNTDERSDGMTDKQYLDHLRELLDTAKSCSTLQEFIKKLEARISSYN